MVQKRTVLSFSILAFSLTACPLDYLDTPTQSGPTVDISVKATDVGEPVQVTLTLGFYGANNNPYTLENQIVGACFRSVKSLGGACENGKEPLVDSLQLLKGSSFEKNFGDVIIEPHENVELKHTFVFTSSVPSKITVIPIGGYEDGAGNTVYYNESPAKVVTFR